MCNNYSHKEAKKLKKRDNTVNKIWQKIKEQKIIDFYKKINILYTNPKQKKVMISKDFIPKEKNKGNSWLYFPVLFISMSITAVYGLLIGVVFIRPIGVFLEHYRAEIIVPISILIVWIVSALVVYLKMKK